MSYITGGTLRTVQTGNTGRSQSQKTISQILGESYNRNVTRGRPKEVEEKTTNPVTGDLVYAKDSAQSFFYTDETMLTVYKGDRQEAAPYRTNNEIVGTATGAMSANGKAIQVTWVNSYWRSGYFKFSLNPKKAIDAALGERVSETVTSWVNINNVYWANEPVDVVQKIIEDDLKRAVLEYNNGNTDTGNTIMYAVGAFALVYLLGGKKKR